MTDLNVIDRFLETFIAYIDSGFGLLGGDVHFLTSVLIGIDITLAGLFWAMGGEQDVLGRLIRKILYVGAFAFILGRFQTLADLVFRSFAAAGITAGGRTLASADLLRPGQLAGAGFAAAWPLLDEVAKLLGFTSFFDNFLTIAILLFAWVLVILAFFILAVQMFVTIIEFKLTALAGFVLVPFALWNRTSFLAERVLGSVVGAGIKVMVLAVIVGIGSGFLTEFASALHGQEPDIADAMSLVLAALTLFGIGIFAPGIAAGLVSGAPQLGAGAALGTTIGAAGIAAVGGVGAIGAARVTAGAALGGIRAATTIGSAAHASYRLGQEAAGTDNMAAGMSGTLSAAAGHVRRKAGNALGLSSSIARGRNAAWAAMRGEGEAPRAGAAAETPAWARSLQRRQDARHHRHVALHALRDGDRGGAGITPDISEKEDRA